jgi:hypothetical protein
VFEKLGLKEANPSKPKKNRKHKNTAIIKATI